MQEFQQKQKIRKAIYSRKVFFIMAIVAIFFVRGAWGVWQKQVESSQKLQDAEVRLAETTSRKEVLSKDIVRLNTPEGIEREIRQRYSVKRSGEEVILVVDPKGVTTTEEIVVPSVWEKISTWFKNLF